MALWDEGRSPMVTRRQGTIGMEYFEAYLQIPMGVQVGLVGGA